MEARQANTEGENEITIRDLIRTSLRMRPDRIIVGEVRGKEAIDMLQAMQTGHDGSMSTGHSNNTKDMLNRLETMVLMGMDLSLIHILEDRDYGISTCGYATEAFTDAGINYIKNKFLDDLSAGNYEKAFSTYAKQCDKFLTKAKEGTAYDRCV